MKLHGIDIPGDKIADFCRRHGVSKLALFGSILRDDFRPNSDIDVLVEYPPGRTPSLLRFAGQQMELTALLGREVHLHTPPMLPPRSREQLRSTARVQYAA